MKGKIKTLAEKFAEIGKNHNKNILREVARNCVGASELRVFESGTKKKIEEFLCGMKIKKMENLLNEQAYESWCEGNCNKLAGLLKRRWNKKIKRAKLKNGRNRRIKRANEYSHAAKILNLFMRDLVCKSRFYHDSQPVSKRLLPWLYVPLDNVVLKKLNQFEGIEKPLPKGMKDVNEKNFFRLQKMLKKAANNVPRVWFDDVWLEKR